MPFSNTWKRTRSTYNVFQFQIGTVSQIWNYRSQMFNLSQKFRMQISNFSAKLCTFQIWRNKKLHFDPFRGQNCNFEKFRIRKSLQTKGMFRFGQLYKGWLSQSDLCRCSLVVTNSIKNYEVHHCKNFDGIKKKKSRGNFNFCNIFFSKFIFSFIFL